MERYFLEPYRFIPPFRGTFWCRIAKRLIPRHLRRSMGVVRWQFEGTEAFHQSLARGAGILLAPNHCRWADPLVMGVFGIQARKYLYYVASYHLFRQSRVMGWILNRIGGYSIWREGSDRESIKTTVRILAEAERPVVIFPEGTWFRQNDRVGQLQDGLSLITRQAAKQCERPIVVHPVGMKYWLLEDPMPELRRRMDSLERRFGWQQQDHLPLLPRIEKLTAALLALKEIEYLGAPRSGSIDERVSVLLDSEIGRLEQVHLGRTHDGWLLERIRRLRQFLSRKLLEKIEAERAGLLDRRTQRDTGEAERTWTSGPVDERDTGEAERAGLLDRRTQRDNREGASAPRFKKDLDNLLFCENLNSHSHQYLLDLPGPERLTETVQRLEEIMTDAVEVCVVPMGVTVSVGPAIDVRANAWQRKPDRNSGDPLVQQIRLGIQEQIDRMLAKGPPAEWGCPGPSGPSGLSVPSLQPPVSALPCPAPAETPPTADSQLIN